MKVPTRSRVGSEGVPKRYGTVPKRSEHDAKTSRKRTRGSRSGPENVRNRSQHDPKRSPNNLLLELCDPQGSSEAHGGRWGALRRPVYNFVKTRLISVPILEPKWMLFRSRLVSVSKVGSRSHFGPPPDSLGSARHALKQVNMRGELDVAHFAIDAVTGASEVAFWLRWEPLWELF